MMRFAITIGHPKGSASGILFGSATEAVKEFVPSPQLPAWFAWTCEPVPVSATEGNLL